MKTHAFLAATAICSMLFAACSPAVYTVGGTMPALNAVTSSDKAQFSLYANSCSTTTGSITYHDKTVFNPKGNGNGLQLTGPIEYVGDCAGATDPDVVAACAYLAPMCGPAESTAPPKVFGGTYYSTNSKYPGTGEFIGCVEDNGHGSKATFKDTGVIALVDGPYGGYWNNGFIQGNVQTYTCP